jgi:hypothetical protein
MKRLLILPFILGSLMVGRAQDLTGADSTSIRQAIVGLFDGIAEIDSAKLAANTTSDFLLLEDGLLWNNDSLFKVLKPLLNESFKRTNEFRFVRGESKGGISWIAYYNTAHIIFNGQKRDVNWLESAVLVREGDRWKVKMLHSTMLRKSLNN